MTRLMLTIGCAFALIQVLAPSAEAGARMHQSPALTKSVGLKCPEGQMKRTVGAKGNRTTECVPKS